MGKEEVRKERGMSGKVNEKEECEMKWVGGRKGGREGGRVDNALSYNQLLPSSSPHQQPLTECLHGLIMQQPPLPLITDCHTLAAPSASSPYHPLPSDWPRRSDTKPLPVMNVLCLERLNAKWSWQVGTAIQPSGVSE